MFVAICDDESIYINIIKEYIAKFEIKYVDNYDTTIDTFNSGEELICSYEEGKRYDIIFIDVRMKVYDGIETAKVIRKMDINSRIIFTTSYRNYVYSAFTVKAFRFLPKPINYESFEEAYSAAICEIFSKNSQYLSIYNKSIGVIKILCDKIIKLESRKRLIYITTTNEEYTYYGILDEEEKKLGKEFVRTHKSYIVNLFYIKRLEKKEVVLQSDEKVPLSESKYSSVLDAFKKYLGR